MDVYLYDRANQETFLGHVNVSPDVFGDNPEHEGWYKLEARDPTQEAVSGEIHLKFTFEKTAKKRYGLEDFEFLKLVGKGETIKQMLSQSTDISQAHSDKCTKCERRTRSKYSH